MKKRFVIVSLLLAVLLCTASYAAQPRASFVPGLTFTGTTANCSVVVSSVNDEINVVLELWEGNTRLKSWEGSGVTYVMINETYPVTKSKTYTLTVNGSIAGVPFGEESITKTCN